MAITVFTRNFFGAAPRLAFEDNAALASLITALANYGLITDSSTA